MTHSPGRRGVVSAGYSFGKRSYTLFYGREVNEYLAHNSLLKVFNYKTVLFVGSYLIIFAMLLTVTDVKCFPKNFINAIVACARSVFAQSFEQQMFLQVLKSFSGLTITFPLLSGASFFFPMASWI